ncbi:MAG: right-handed parallel beta-helix repeat-containing protein [Clostridia bacterium]|nr:right-handed parallel beta-helix repeat-containing protein [Clostridia bacterium]
MPTYYVAGHGCDTNDGLTSETPWKTIAKANQTISCGDTVCFRRGDTFYGAILPPDQPDGGEFTTYSAYGDGPKPVVSQFKIANKDAWESCGDHIWRLDLLDTGKFTGNITEMDTNIGFIKVSGKIYGCNSFTPEKLENDWDFCADEQYIYIKSEENPGERSDDIRIACNIRCVTFADYLKVENIVFNGTGGHGIAGMIIRHAHIDNCEFHEIGGSVLDGFGTNVRYGNGIECWTDSCDVLIENCRFSQIYDVAFTMQGNEVTKGWRDITVRNCVMWNNQQSFEVWSDGNLPDTGFVNCVFENNTCLYAGYGWSYEVRPDKENSSHLLMYHLVCPLNGIEVRNNTFAGARLHTIFKAGGPGYVPEDYHLTGNTILRPAGQPLINREDASDAVYEAFCDRIAGENRILDNLLPGMEADL